MRIEKAMTVKGHAIGEVCLGKSSKQQTPQIEVFFRVSTKGDHEGEKVKWTGYFGPKSAARTIESLQLCGWEGEDVGEFADGELHGIDTNEVELVIEIEEYEATVRDENGDPVVDEHGNEQKEQRSGPRVAWVNDPNRGGRLNVQNAMSKDEAANFGEQMKGLVLKARAKRPKGADAADAAADFPHGANAPKATGTTGRRF